MLKSPKSRIVAFNKNLLYEFLSSGFNSSIYCISYKFFVIYYFRDLNDDRAKTQMKDALAVLIEGLSDPDNELQSKNIK